MHGAIAQKWHFLEGQISLWMRRHAGEKKDALGIYPSILRSGPLKNMGKKYNPI